MAAWIAQATEGSNMEKYGEELDWIGSCFMQFPEKSALGTEKFNYENSDSMP